MFNLFFFVFYFNFSFAVCLSPFVAICNLSSDFSPSLLQKSYLSVWDFVTCMCVEYVCVFSYIHVCMLVHMYEISCACMCILVQACVCVFKCRLCFIWFPNAQPQLVLFLSSATTSCLFQCLSLYYSGMLLSDGYIISISWYILFLVFWTIISG